MNVFFAPQSLPKSRGGIFLAGPTPRSSAHTSWRPEAIELLKSMGFNGAVFVPEREDWATMENYDEQINWEWSALDLADQVAFWVPRELEKMPAFTTNVEFGLMIQQGKAVLGYPETAPKMRYLHALADRYSAPVYHDLKSTLTATLARI